ncbi:hypothetical protein VB773_17565 [Haloarculaceae archaeon H-GB2-1]|nr:hypothetical protein [Haloarculaceae archaeon H-GB1-1]MEA5387707.1 hypothetical protein [Haloarculaceae archaeon H-GB11]MEA5409199.1 hypothetical protein [Haloarculaceae archaeon H-GB2-1]
MDDRARVPFALVGVVLLVGSATLTATLGHRPLPTEPAVDESIERTSAATRTALRGAAVTAGQNAAATPVLSRANTSTGRVLNASQPYRDALRVRIYVRARQRLDAIRHRRAGVTTTASLPATPNATALRKAKRRVDVESVGPNGTKLQVTIANVTVTARRDGEVVGRSRFSPTVVVSTPTLALHRRVSAYEDRLNRGISRPGLGQRLTARMYAVTWARGYAQYGGAPVENVVANRHVELMTNGALLAEQRYAFGTSDPGARRALAVGTARTGVADLTATSPNAQRWSQRLLRPNAAVPSTVPRLASDADAAGPNSTMQVGVNRTAVDVFRRTTSEENLTAILRSTYSAEVRVHTSVETVEQAPRPELKELNRSRWTLQKDYVGTSARTLDTFEPTTPEVENGHVIATYGRIVRVNHRHVGKWRWRGLSRETTNVTASRKRVRVTLVGTHARTAHGPNRTIRTVHERGRGPLDGPNLANVTGKAHATLVEERGGPGHVAEQAAMGETGTLSRVVYGERPADLSRWVYADLMGLREHIRDVTVTVRRGKVGTYETNPPAELAEAVRERRAELVGAPDSYHGVADRARVAVRAAYVDRVIAALERRADRRRRQGRALDERLQRKGAGSLGTLREGLAVRDEPRDVARERGLATTVDASPQYLTVSSVGHDLVPAVPEGETRRPLAARNLNVVTVPYDDVVSGLFDVAFLSPERTRLSSAARALRAANETLETRANRSLRIRRDRLQHDVERGNEEIRWWLLLVLDQRGVGDTEAERERVLDEALGRWDSSADRALALSNGSATDAIVAVAARRHPDAVGTTVARDRLRIRLSGAIRASVRSSSVQPRQRRVNESVTRTQAVVDGELRRIAEKRAKDRAAAAVTDAGNRTAQRVVNHTLEEVPAGLPVAPAPGYWYATVNVWHVEARGEYERFVVRAHRGTPESGGGTVAYVRDGSVARLDVDGDGSAERLGRADRISFETETVVVVVVPPGKAGMGDKDGNWDERSAGWPDPGSPD